MAWIYNQVEAGAVASGSDALAARRDRKTKNDAAPIRTVTITPSKLKMPALTLLAMFESDLPKQAAQARAALGEARVATITVDETNVNRRFINS